MKSIAEYRKYHSKISEEIIDATIKLEQLKKIRDSLELLFEELTPAHTRAARVSEAKMVVEELDNECREQIHGEAESTTVTCPKCGEEHGKRTVNCAWIDCDCGEKLCGQCGGTILVEMNCDHEYWCGLRCEKCGHSGCGMCE